MDVVACGTSACSQENRQPQEGGNSGSTVPDPVSPSDHLGFRVPIHPWLQAPPSIGTQVILHLVPCPKFAKNQEKTARPTRGKRGIRRTRPRPAPDSESNRLHGFRRLSGAFRNCLIPFENTNLTWEAGEPPDSPPSGLSITCQAGCSPTWLKRERQHRV